MPQKKSGKYNHAFKETENRIDVEDLLKCSNLDKMQKNMIRMRYLSSMSLNDIRLHYNKMPIATVRKYINVALSKLRRHLETHEQ